MTLSYAITAFHRWLGQIQKYRDFSTAASPLWVMLPMNFQCHEPFHSQGHSIMCSDASHRYPTRFSICKLANTTVCTLDLMLQVQVIQLQGEKYPPNLLLPVVYPNTTCVVSWKKKCRISSLWPLILTQFPKTTQDKHQHFAGSTQKALSSHPEPRQHTEM